MKLIKLDITQSSEEMDLFSLFSSYCPEAQQQSCLYSCEVWTHGDDDSVYLEVGGEPDSVVEYLRMSSLFFDTRELITILTNGTEAGYYLLVTGSDLASPYMAVRLYVKDDITYLSVFYSDTETDNHGLAAKLARDGVLAMDEYVSITPKDNYILTRNPDLFTEICIALSEDEYLVDQWRRGFHLKTEVFTKTDLIRFLMTADSIVNTSVNTSEIDGVPDENDYDYIFSTNSGIDYPVHYCLSVRNHPLVMSVREAMGMYEGVALVMATIDVATEYWSLVGSTKIAMLKLFSTATKLASE